MAQEYYHKEFKCPFYEGCTRLTVRCEGGTLLSFPDQLSIKLHIATVCCDGWEKCSVSKMLNDYYDRKEDMR